MPDTASAHVMQRFLFEIVSSQMLGHANIAHACACTEIRDSEVFWNLLLEVMQGKVVKLRLQTTYRGGMYYMYVFVKFNIEFFSTIL